MAEALSGRSALITGTASGLGHAFARRLADAGVNVLLSDLEEAETMEERCRDMARACHVEVAYVRADLADLSQIEALVSASHQRFGGADILVNNAVTRHFAPLTAFPVEHWNRALAVNVSAAFHLIRLLLPAMQKKGYGRIINMTSVYGHGGVAGRVDYATTKAAILGLTRATAMEVSAEDVSCHALCPGSVLTPAIERRVRKLMEERGIDLDEATKIFLEGKQPSGRFVEIDSVADALIFLCGRAGRDMNGSVLPVDGGWLAKA